MAEDNLEERYRKLEQHNVLVAALDGERGVSDGKYAIKLVEKIVFGFIAALALAVLASLLTLVLK